MIGEEISVIYSVANGSVCPEWAYKIVVTIFVIVVAVCLVFSAWFLFFSIQRKRMDNKKFANEQTEEYFEGYIKGAKDRKYNTVAKLTASAKHNYLQGYIDGHKDDKFWKQRKKKTISIVGRINRRRGAFYGNIKIRG